MKVIASRNNGPNFPSHPSIDLNHQQYGPTLLVLTKCHAVVRGHRNINSGNKRRPYVNVLVALVCGWYGGVVGDLLVAVGGVSVELIVIYTDFGVGVTGGDGDLEVGGEEVGVRGEVEVVNSGVLEGKTGFFGLEDGPYDEDSEEDEEEDD